MNCTVLSALDDLSKVVILDQIGYKTKKINKSVVKLTKHVSHKFKTIMDNFQRQENIKSTVSQIMQILVEEKLLYQLNIPWLKWMTNFLEMYLNCLKSSAKVSIKICSEYSLDNYQGLKVVALEVIQKNDIIQSIYGHYSKISKHEENILALSAKDFSIMYSARTRSPMLLLGVIAFINHSCTPNCAYKSLDGGKATLVALKTINVNEELTCFYSPCYFGENNVECECQSCIKKNSHEALLLESKIQHSNIIDKKSEDIQIIADKNMKVIVKEREIKKVENKVIKKLRNVEKKNNFVIEKAVTQEKEEEDERSQKSYEYNLLKLSSHINRIRTDLNNSSQRRINQITNKGLKYDCKMYENLILCLNKVENINISTLRSNEEAMKNIIKSIYKTDHCSNFFSLRKFMEAYEEDILNDLKSSSSVILAPEFKKMQAYLENVIKIGIEQFLDEFADCIYYGTVMSLESKKKFLNYLHGESNVGKKEKTKFDNCLNLYKYHIQSILEKSFKTATQKLTITKELRVTIEKLKLKN